MPDAINKFEVDEIPTKQKSKEPICTKKFVQ